MMSHASVRASAPAMPRRLFLAAGPAAAVFAALQGAATSPARAISADARLFVLIEEGKRSWARLGELIDVCEQDSPEDEATLSQVNAEYEAAFDAMMRTTPQTVAGMRAQLEWLRKDAAGLMISDDHLLALIAGFLASPILNVGA